MNNLSNETKTNTLRPIFILKKCVTSWGKCSKCAISIWASGTGRRCRTSFRCSERKRAPNRPNWGLSPAGRDWTRSPGSCPAYCCASELSWRSFRPRRSDRHWKASRATPPPTCIKRLKVKVKISQHFDGLRSKRVKISMFYAKIEGLSWN